MELDGYLSKYVNEGDDKIVPLATTDIDSLSIVLNIFRMFSIFIDLLEIANHPEVIWMLFEMILSTLDKGHKILKKKLYDYMDNNLPLELISTAEESVKRTKYHPTPCSAG